MSRALITGASGFIGRQLAAALVARGNSVTCLVRSRSDVDHLKSLDAQLIEGDVTVPESLPAAVAEADVVYHLAGLTRARNRAEFLSVNEAGVANILDACRRPATPPTVVVVSSLAAAGPSPADRPRREADPPAPVSNYGRSKRAGELAALARAAEMPITIVRPPIVLGEGDATGLALFQMVARSGIHLVMGFRPVWFSVIHVADLVAALILAAERGQRLPKDGDPGSGAAGQAEEIKPANFPGSPFILHPSSFQPVDPRGYYFVGDNHTPSYRELGLLIGHALGRRRTQIVRLPRRTLWVVAALGEAAARLRGRAPYVGFDKAREALAGHWTCSTVQAATELGFAPAADLPTRLRQTADWYRREGWL